MEEDDAYNTGSAYSDAEVDSEVEDVDMEHEFGVWLEELNSIQQDGGGEVKKTAVTPKHVMDSMRCSLVTTSSDGGFSMDDLDDMLSEFNDIVDSINTQQNQLSTSLQAANTKCVPKPAPNEVSSTVEDLDSQLMSALLELDDLAGTKSLTQGTSEPTPDKSLQAVSHNRLSYASSSSDAEGSKPAESLGTRESSPHKLSTRLMAPKTLPKETFNPISDVLSVLSEGLPYPELQDLLSPDALDRGSDRDSAYSDSTSIPSSGSHVSVGTSSHSGSAQPPPPANTSRDSDPTAVEKAGKEEKLRQALEKIKEAKIRKLFVRAYTPDGSSKSILVDEKMTVGQIRDALVTKNHAQPSFRWAVIEQLPDLLMERVLEDHDYLVESMVMWTRDSSNKVMFDERPGKYDVFLRPELYLLENQDPANPMNESDRDSLIQEYFSEDVERVPELEGPLYMKADGKKAWKRFFFTLRASGLYYNPKGKGKSSKDLVCLQKFNLVEVYTGVGWKKKYKAPSDYCIALKHPQIQKKSSKYIRYLCAEDQKSFYRWLTGIRIAKHGYKLYKNFRATSNTIESWSQDDHSANPNFPDYLAKQNEVNQQIARRHSTMRIPNSPVVKKMENGSIPSMSTHHSNESLHKHDSPSHRHESPSHRHESPSHRHHSPSHRHDSLSQRSESPSHRNQSPQPPSHQPVSMSEAPLHYDQPPHYSQDIIAQPDPSTQTMPRRKSLDMLDGDFDEPCTLQRGTPRRSSVQHLDLTATYEQSPLRRAGTIHRSENINSNVGGSMRRKVPVLPLTANTTKMLGEQTASTMRRVSKETVARSTILPATSQSVYQTPPLAGISQRSYSSLGHSYGDAAGSDSHYHSVHRSTGHTLPPPLSSMSHSFPSAGRVSPHRFDSQILHTQSSTHRKDSRSSPQSTMRKKDSERLPSQPPSLPHQPPTLPPQPPSLPPQNQNLPPSSPHLPLPSPTLPPASPHSLPPCPKQPPSLPPQPPSKKRNSQEFSKTSSRQHPSMPPPPPPLRPGSSPISPPPVSPKPGRPESPGLPPPPPVTTHTGCMFGGDDLPPPPPELLDASNEDEDGNDLPPPPPTSELISLRPPAPLPAETSHYASAPVRVTSGGHMTEGGQEIHQDKRASISSTHSITSTHSSASSASSHVYDEPHRMPASPTHKPVHQRATALPNVPPGYKTPRPYYTGSSSANSSPSHRPRPPPPPKRSDSTRLTTVSYASPSYVINDLQRMLKDKHTYMGGYASHPMTGPLPIPAHKPLPEDCMSSMSFQYLPPPPADLLQGLRTTRKKPPPPVTPRRSSARK